VDELPGRKNLIAALIRAQKTMPNIKFDSVNPHFGNRYASFATTRDETLPYLNAEGLTITQATQVFMNVTPPVLLLVTTLAHESGEEITAGYPLPWLPEKPQVMGSAISYAKRYGWQAILAVASEEDDDDGERATVKPKESKGKTVDEAFPKTQPKPQAKIGPERQRFVRIAHAAVAAGKLPADMIASSDAIRGLLSELLAGHNGQSQVPADWIQPDKMGAVEWQKAADKLAAQSGVTDPLDQPATK